MNNERVQAEQMKFLFISNPNTFATYTCGVPLRSCIYIFIALLFFFSIILYLWAPLIFTESSLIEMTVCLIVLAGPITENFNLCWVLTVAFSVLTIIEACWKVYIGLVILSRPTPTEAYVLLLVMFIHLVLWFVTVYVYFSYTKSLGLGLLPTEVNQNNSLALIQANDPRCQIPATSLRVDQNPTIILTNPVDLAFLGDKQGLVVSGATLPSGLVVPSGGYGKNWKVVGNSITLV
jgi:hypothetical protein